MNENDEVQAKTLEQESQTPEQEQGASVPESAATTQESEQQAQEPVPEVASEQQKPDEQQGQEGQDQEESLVMAEPKKKLEKSGKKKRGACFTCCLSLLIFNFVCMCLLLTVGWVLGDQLSRQTLGMPLSDTFGVVRSIRKSKSPKIDNPYSAADEDGFYDAIGDALLLNEGVIDGDDLKDTLKDSLKNEGDMGSALGDYFVNIMQSENLNQSKIESIGTDEQDTNLTISDRELAAFLNGIIAAAVESYASDALKEAELDEMGFDFGKLSFEDYVKLNQIKLYIDNNINKVKLTASVDFGKVLKEFKSALNVKELASSLAKEMEMESLTPVLKFAIGRTVGLAKMILPSKLYVTIDAGLSQSVEPIVQINNMSASKMENLYTMLAAVHLDVKGEINNAFVGEEGAVKTALDSINNEVPLSEVFADGKIDCDVFKLLIGIAKLNYDKVDDEYVLKPQDEQITSQDFLNTLQLILREKAPLNDPNSEYYFYRNDNKSAIDAYNKANEDALLDRLGEKYGLNTDEYSLDEILHVLGIIELSDPKVDGLEIYDIIDKNKIDTLASTTGNWQDTLKVNIDNVTYIENSKGIDMFTSLIKKVIFDGSSVDTSSLGDFDKDDLLFVKLDNENGKQYLSIVIKVLIKDLLPEDAEDGELGIGLITGLISSAPSLITLKVDISDTNSHDRTEVIVNNNEGGSESLFRVLKCFGIDIGFEEVGDNIRDAYFNVKDKLDIKYGDKALVLPNVFALIDDMMLNGKYNDGGKNVHDAFNLIYKSSDRKIDAFEASIAPNKIAQDKMDIETLISAMRGDGISDQQFGAYIADTIAEKAGELVQFNILAANPDVDKQRADRRNFETLDFMLDNAKTYITMTVKISVDKMGNMPSDFAHLLPQNMLITFVLEFNDAEGKFEYKDFVINDSDRVSRNALLDLTGVGDAVKNLEDVADDCLAPVNNLLQQVSDGGIVQMQHSFIEDRDLDSTIRGHYKSVLVM